MSDITLPSNVKQDPNTGLYVITSPSGKTFRVGADTQSQLDQYVNSVNTNTPTSVTVIDPNTGDPKSRVFDPDTITKSKNSIDVSNALMTQTKRSTGIVGNLDGSYTNLKTNETLTKEQASSAIAAAGLPPEAIDTITPKNSTTYATATAVTDNRVNVPSGVPLSPLSDSTQPPAAINATNTYVPPESDPVVSNQNTNTGAPAIPESKQSFKPAVVVNQSEAETARLARINATATSEPEQVNQSEAETARLARSGVIPVSTPETVTNEPAVGTGGAGKPGESAVGGTPLLAEVQQARQSNNDANVAVPFSRAPDLRVRVTLAPGANYLYKVGGISTENILYPLSLTNGVIFPYMPKINVTYQASYDPVDVAHSNYKIYNYKNSSIENVSITGVFTAQNVIEANYVLAVIHFFRSVTKMFYGKDENPKKGTPPPLVYLSGLGAYNFDNHPMLVNSFTLNYPDDVDYINAGATTGGVNLAEYGRPTNLSQTRLSSSGLGPGGSPPTAKLVNRSDINSITRVPTKISLSISCYPVITRNAISNNFSLAQYATGQLLRGSQNPKNGGGIW